MSEPKFVKDNETGQSRAVVHTDEEVKAREKAAKEEAEGRAVELPHGQKHPESKPAKKK